MISVLFGSLSAVGFGAGDFLGALAAKRLTAMLVTALAALAGVAGLLLAAPLDGGVWHAETTVVGVLTGVTSCLGIWLLYSAYARGPMTTLAPIVAIVSTVVPMTAGLLSGEQLSALGWASLAVGLLAIGLVSAPRGDRRVPTHRVDALKAALAGAFLGVLYIHLDSAPLDSGLTPLTANRLSCAVLAFAIVLVLALRGRRAGTDLAAAPASAPSAHSTGAVATLTRPVTAVRRQSAVGLAVALACAGGLLDATANTLFLVGLEHGDLTVLSVVSGFYPAVTILLALIVLRERPSRLQVAGIALALLSMLGMAIA